MKRSLLALSLIPGVIHADADTDYVNFIRQIQQDTGVEWDVSVAPSGDTFSPTGVSVDGAFFELWSIHNGTAVEYLLDEQFVTSYTPNATIQIQTGDPYEAVARTRVDQPFLVKVTVNGLLDPNDPAYPAAPAAAKQVDYLHATVNYPAGSHSIPSGANPSGTLLEEGYMEVNGTAQVYFGATNLTGPDLTKVEGEEVFTISAQADFGVSATVLDSKRIQVWPIADATLSGFDPNDYYEDVPPIVVTLNDLYPASATYVRIYAGASQATPADVTIIPDSYVLISDSIPQDKRLTLRNVDKLFSKEGLHTVEVIHETPFGADLLASGSINVDRTVVANAGVYAAE